jgi:outer membrane protein TolC
MHHAESLHARAQAVLEESRNLIGLEAENAYFRWQEASEQVAEGRQATEAGDKLAEGLNTDFVSGLKVRIDEVVNARVLASQARSQYNEFLYHRLLAVAELQRVTAGGFCAGLVELVVPRPAAASEEGSKTK